MNSKRVRKPKQENDKESNNIGHSKEKRHKIPEVENNINNDSNTEGASMNNNEKKPKKKQELKWPNEDLIELTQRMKACIPENDNLAYGTRVDKLEWDNITFKNYSVKDCQNTWGLLQKSIRRYRLLNEVLSDAQEWIKNKKDKNAKGKRAARHPDMPKRPLSSYLLFYMKKKDKVSSENPGLEVSEISKKIGHMYNSLPQEKKAKYEALALKSKQEYEEQLEKFFDEHPDRKRPEKIEKVKPPKRPQTPFGCFYAAELKKKPMPDSEKNAFKEDCKETWKVLSDKKKFFWINWAEEEYAKYQEELKKYMASHPDYVPHPIKTLLTKDEKQIKERASGKPVKPPNSAYGLFSRTMLQSNEIKAIPVKERLNYVSGQWRELSETDKQHYKDLSLNMIEKYKAEYASYLETLPEEQRNLELLVNAPRKRKAADEGSSAPPKKRRSIDKQKPKDPPKPRTRKPRTKPAATKLSEPEQPPISAFKYFVSLYKGTDPPTQAWKALTSDEKQKYEKDLIKKKHEYIVEFERFLKSLTKEELEAFSNSRKKQAVKTEAEEEDDEGEEESSSGSEGSEEDSDEEQEEDTD